MSKGKGGGRRKKRFWEPMRSKGDASIKLEAHRYGDYLGMSHMAGIPLLFPPQNSVKIMYFCKMASIRSSLLSNNCKHSIFVLKAKKLLKSTPGPHPMPQTPVEQTTLQGLNLCRWLAGTKSGAAI